MDPQPLSPLTVYLDLTYVAVDNLNTIILYYFKSVSTNSSSPPTLATSEGSNP